MLEAVGNLWDWYDKGYWAAITTNGMVREDWAVMGAGLAKQAAIRFPSLPYKLGRELMTGGNKVNYFRPIRIITFPTKGHWTEVSSDWLVERSAEQLMEVINEANIPNVVLGRPGCGLGGLEWEKVVKPLIAPILDDRVLVVTNE